LPSLSATQETASLSTPHYRVLVTKTASLIDAFLKSCNYHGNIALLIMLCYILCILYVCSTCIIFICGVVLCKSVRLSYLNKGNLLRPTYLLRHSSLSGYEDGSQRSECSLLTGQKKYTLPGQRFLAATSIINEAVFCVDNVDPSVTVMICVCL